MFPISATAAGYAGMSGNYIPEIWSGKLLEKFYTATVFGSIANTDYEGEIKEMGDKVWIRTIPDILIKDYQIGMNLVYDRPAPTVVSLLVDKGKYYGYPVNDVEKLQADIDYMNRWSDDAGKQLGITIDSAILADIDADAHADNIGTTAGAESEGINLGTTGTAGENAVALTKTNILEYIVHCGLVLDEQNVPDDNRWFVLPKWATALIKLSDLKDASFAGDGKSLLIRRDGRMGMIDRFEIYGSNNMTATTETSTKCYPTLFGHKSALTFASQLTKNEMIDNPTDFGKLVRGLQVYGYEVIKPEAMGVLYCKNG